jgi:probable rRNA maturation factor
MKKKESALELTVQYASDRAHAPSRTKIARWIRAALKKDAEIAVRFVDESEARQLNRNYRGRDKPTNVLSFLYESGPPLIGDIALCLPLARDEARKLAVNADARIAHLLVHAVLHLQGFDHETDDDAQAMQARESEIVTGLGFADPYSRDFETAAVFSGAFRSTREIASTFCLSESSGFASDSEHSSTGPK